MAIGYRVIAVVGLILAASRTHASVITTGPCSGAACASSTMCRSNYGYCGTGTAYCNVNSIWTSDCVPGATSAPTSTSSCPGSPCSDPTMCRSAYGYCGTGAAYCNSQSTWTSTDCGSVAKTSSPSVAKTSSPSIATKAPSLRTSSPVTASPKTSSKSPTAKSSSTGTPTSMSPSTAFPSSKSPTTGSPNSNSHTTGSPNSKAPTTGSPNSNSPSTSPSASVDGGCSGLPCADPTMCRSQWGYCGTGSSYCNAQSTWTSTGCTAAPTSTSAPTAPTTLAPTTVNSNVADLIIANSAAISSQLFVTLTPENTWIPSTIYFVDDLVSAIYTAETGIGGLELIGTGIQGYLNVAAFIAEAMEETIQYDACDENNWDFIDGAYYPASNACGQLGESYQDYTCAASEAFMECPLDPTMEAQALTNARWYGAPPPLYGGPINETGADTPGWNPYATCAGNVCNVYPGQQGGAWEYGVYPNTAGRTDVQNCVWWGRGAIQLTGRCNIGKLNYYLGQAAAARNATTTLYPDVNFCADPSAICHSTKYPELKWVSALLYWLQNVQSYNVDSWNYVDQLAALAANPSDQTMRASFINGVSGIVNQGSATSTANNQAQRAANFETVYSIFFS